MALSQISRTFMRRLQPMNRYSGVNIMKLVSCKHCRSQSLCVTQFRSFSDSSSNTQFNTGSSIGKQSTAISELSAESKENSHSAVHNGDKDLENQDCENSVSNPKFDNYLQTEEEDFVLEMKSNDHFEIDGMSEDEDSDAELELIPKSESDLEPISKHVEEQQFHLGAYVNQSETLTQLVRLGVDLSQVQRVRGASDMLVKLDFESQVKPYLFFLHDVGVSNDDIGHYISKNPLIFKEDLADLEARVQYLKSKKLSKDAISRIVSKAHVLLLMPVQIVDAKLGYLQKEYRLTGDEVRSVVTQLPKIISWNRHKLKDNRFYIKEFLGFSNAELKKILVTCPKIFVTNRYSLGKKFDYLYNTMEIDHKTLVEWPKIFRTRLHLIQQRHRFLLSVDRAQYNPKKENFVSLQTLVVGTDKDFCRMVAKVSVAQYNNFLKSI